MVREGKIEMKRRGNNKKNTVSKKEQYPPKQNDPVDGGISDHSNDWRTTVAMTYTTGREVLPTPLLLVWSVMIHRFLGRHTQTQHTRTHTHAYIYTTNTAIHNTHTCTREREHCTEWHHAHNFEPHPDKRERERDRGITRRTHIERERDERLHFIQEKQPPNKHIQRKE